MPRLLAVGHVTWDRLRGQEVLGGSVTYAAVSALKLGWEAAILTAAGPEFVPERDLPGVHVFLNPAPATTRFRNDYTEGGRRHQMLSSRATDVELSPLPAAWWNPDVLLLGPVAGELPGVRATAFRPSIAGALAQGWLRRFDTDGTVSPREWPDPGSDLVGVHALFLSENDLPEGRERAPGFLAHVPIVALTRGWKGVLLFTREGVRDVPALPRAEVDPTGAGDVFAASFLVRYHETGDVSESTVFAVCAASCAVEGLGASGLGTREEILRRVGLWERLIEDGEWDE